MTTAGMNAEDSILWDTILLSYTKFFKYARLCGVFPYSFNPKALTLTPDESGASYYFFVFNVVYIFINFSKAALLLLLSWWTRFEFIEIEGGYFFQVAWMIGGALCLGMMHSFSRNRKEFPAALSTSIQLERKTLTGTVVELIVVACFNIGYKQDTYFLNSHSHQAKQSSCFISISSTSSFLELLKASSTV
jgi:hypothetical protein